MPHDNLSFDAWKALVDKEVQKRIFVGCDDIPDVDYRGLWSSGDTPEDAAEFALDESGMTWRSACSDS